ncbi:hypothetical protein DCS_01530 [Drechmeria coniospora]|uniref:CCHC-type domain-containing protein n=1 Tax=Drechmeria coniospora TaxID=98403 RepID=A0A151GTK4_DRECN|nr:hypothetical protein DCS_01530 [Drechmeria coniospora]KYK60393.1 hypothetical protein DCS_01530 [Drechmeria coniospora]
MADWGQSAAAAASWGTAAITTGYWGDSGKVADGATIKAGDENRKGFDDREQERENTPLANGEGDDVVIGVGLEPEKCFNCDQPGHQVAECPAAREMICHNCKQPGHMLKMCPDKPPMVCSNCGLEGHTRNKCENARKINRDHVADVSPDTAWAKLEKAVAERDADDTKAAVQEYVKAIGGVITYRELQEAMFDKGINLFLIATERSLVTVFTNMDLQGNMGKKYSISYRFSEKPDRPREADSFPKSRDELLARLEDAGEVVDSGKVMCRNCGELGHPSNKSGHKATECEEPPNLDNVECRKCNERSKVQCSNCQEYGHTKVRCNKPPGEFEGFDATGFENQIGHSNGHSGGNMGGKAVDDSWTAAVAGCPSQLAA